MSREKSYARGVRSGPAKYASRAKFLLILLSIAVFPAIMILTALACNVKGAACAVYSVVVALLALSWLIVYGVYSFRVSMGTVIGIEVTAKVVHLYTKRKTFTYDAHMGCVAVKVKRNRYVCTFETQDSRDSFLFYRHAPFSKYSDEQFTEEDIVSFCPAFEGEDYAARRMR